MGWSLYGVIRYMRGAHYMGCPLHGVVAIWGGRYMGWSLYGVVAIWGGRYMGDGRYMRGCQLHGV